MEYFKIGDVIVPSEFIVIKDVSGTINKNTHYVIVFNTKFNFVNITRMNGKDFVGWFNAKFFSDYFDCIKPYSLESFNNLKVFL